MVRLQFSLQGSSYEQQPDYTGADGGDLYLYDSSGGYYPQVDNGLVYLKWFGVDPPGLLTSTTGQGLMHINKP